VSYVVSSFVQSQLLFVRFRVHPTSSNIGNIPECCVKHSNYVRVGLRSWSICRTSVVLGYHYYRVLIEHGAAWDQNQRRSSDGRIALLKSSVYYLKYLQVYIFSSSTTLRILVLHASPKRATSSPGYNCDTSRLQLYSKF